MPQATRNPAIVQLENAATSYPKPHQGSLSMIVSSRSAIVLRDGVTSGASGDGLLVVRPHSQDMHDVAIGEDLVDKPMLDVDASRVTAG